MPSRTEVSMQVDAPNIPFHLHPNFVELARQFLKSHKKYILKYFHNWPANIQLLTHSQHTIIELLTHSQAFEQSTYLSTACAGNPEGILQALLPERVNGDLSEQSSRVNGSSRPMWPSKF